MLYPKLLLTKKCNRSCDFCFQSDLEGNATDISLEDFQSLLLWLKKQSIDTLTLLGGEPSLHPYFLKILEISFGNGFKLNLLTNLIFDGDLIDFFGCVSSVCANINPKDQYTKTEWDVLERNLRILEDRRVEVIPSITMYDKNISFDEVFWVFLGRFSNINNIRVDLSRPSLRKTNSHVSSCDIFLYKEKLLFVFDQIESFGLDAVLDCPFPKCYFTAREIETYSLYAKGLNHNECGNLIVNTDLSIGTCPFYNFNSKRIVEFEDLFQVAKLIEDSELLKSLKFDKYTLNRCLDCGNRKDMSCSGYCVADKA